MGCGRGPLRVCGPGSRPAYQFAAVPSCPNSALLRAPLTAVTASAFAAAAVCASSAGFESPEQPPKPGTAPGTAVHSAPGPAHGEHVAASCVRLPHDQCTARLSGCAPGLSGAPLHGPQHAAADVSRLPKSFQSWLRKAWKSRLRAASLFASGPPRRLAQPAPDSPGAGAGADAALRSEFQPAAGE